MSGAAARPAPSPGFRVELTTAEMEAVIRFHRLEAVLLLNGNSSRGHMRRADQLHRIFSGSSA